MTNIKELVRILSSEPRKFYLIFILKQVMSIG